MRGKNQQPHILHLTFTKTALLIIGVGLLGYLGYVSVLGNTFFNTTITTNTDLENGLILHYTFDGDTISVGGSTTTIIDRSGQSNNGGLLESVESGTASSTVYATTATSTFTVPAGVTSIEVKAWGGGGGGGASSDGTAAGNGAGGGYITGTIAVTPGEDLLVIIGNGGGGAEYTPFGTPGGGGGGYSGLFRGSATQTDALFVAGGGGGGAARINTTRDGGAGGGAVGEDGVDSSGSGGTQSSGGMGTSDGEAGSALQGGQGEDGEGTNFGGEGSGGNPGSGGDGGHGGNSGANHGGGGGGGGWYGGGGGANGGATGGTGGGGGSSFATSTATATSTTAGSGTSAGNNSDGDYAGSAGQGGIGSIDLNDASGGNPGRVVLNYSILGNATTTYSAATSTATYTVPSGASSIKVKAWGGGGGGSGGGTTGSNGASGGGGGYIEGTIEVTPGEELNVFVGNGGGGGIGGASNGGAGGGGGGYSGIKRGTNELLIAGGGGGAGGGDGGNASRPGAAGGPGGGTTGTSGSNPTTGAATGGSGGTQSSGGSAGTGAQGNGEAGSFLSGGQGAYRPSSLGGGGGGGTNGGGDGAQGSGSGNDGDGGAGGGGGGYYGGGGGGVDDPGAGGGGGSSFATTTATATSTVSGSGTSAGNNSDGDYEEPAGQGGSAGAASGGLAGSGVEGRVVIVAYGGGSESSGTMQGALTTKPGSIGQSIAFNGTDNFIDVGDVGAARTISFWIKTDDTTSQKLVNIDGTDQIELNGSNQVVATSFPGATVYIDGEVGSTISAGEWHHVLVTDSTGVSASTFEIGRVDNNYFEGTIDDMRVYDRVLSTDEIERLYELGATTKINTTITTNPDLENGLIGHWTFDAKHIVNSTTTDRSASGNDGLSSTTPTVVPGRIGQALEFNGVDDGITVPHSSDFVLSDISTSFWIYSDEQPTNTGIITKKNTSVDVYTITFDNTEAGKLEGCVDFVDDSTVLCTTSDSVIETGRWYHYAMTASAGGSLISYIDGVQQADTETLSSGTLDNTDDLTIGTGIRPTATIRRFFNGKLDDVRIYDRVLSAEEVTRLYQLGATTRFNTTIVSNDSLENGLVGHWTFDGKDIDFSTTTAELQDRSGNGNHVDWIGHATTTVPGKMGQAIEFLSDSDYGSRPDSISLQSPLTAITMSVWARPNGIISGNSYPWLFGKVYGFSGPYASYQIYQVAANSRQWASDITINGTQRFTAATDDSLINENEWYFLVARWSLGNRITLDVYNSDGTLNQSVESSSTYTGTISYTGQNFVIGTSEVVDDWSGTLDDIRVYDRALSDDEVQRLLQLGS